MIITHVMGTFIGMPEMGTDAFPWAFLSCTLRNTGSPVQIAMANPLVVRRVITDPLHSIFYGGSLVLCLDLAMLCDPLMRLCVRRLRSHFTVTYLPLFPLTCTPTYASYSRSIRCPGTSRIQFICTRSKLQISRMRKWCVPAKPMTALLNPLVFVVVVAPYVVHKNLILLFRYHICLPPVAVGEHLDVALQIHLSLSMRMFPT